jgi:hypothetical protein
VIKADHRLRIPDALLRPLADRGVVELRVLLWIKSRAEEIMRGLVERTLRHGIAAAGVVAVAGQARQRVVAIKVMTGRIQ